MGLNFVICIECEINKDYTFTLLAKIVLGHASSGQMVSLHVHSSMYLTYHSKMELIPRKSTLQLLWSIFGTNT